LETGLFAQTIGLLAKKQGGPAQFAALRCLQGVAGGRQIVEAWLRPLLASAASKPDLRVLLEPERKRQETPAKPQNSSRSYDRKNAQRKVEEQKDKIIRWMRSGHWEKAALAVDGLLDYQRRFGGGGYAAKSLCDLAVEAKELNRHDFQLQLTRRAIEQNPEDGWAWAQHGDALLMEGQLQEALQAYENSVGFGQFSVGSNGRAEALKAMGRYPEALEAYEAAARAHPENTVAKAGYAETLKAMGRYAEALEAYAAVVRAHPQDAVAKAGYAETLKAMGRYAEALEAYAAVVRAHPQDAVAKAGYAETLKAMGRYPEALEAYAAAMRAHPENAVAKAGRAETLKAMGDLAAAASAYAAIWEQHPDNWVVRSGYAIVLFMLGEHSQALGLLPSIKPNSFGDWIAWHIRGMALLRMGRLAEALPIFEQGVEEGPASSRDYFRSALALARSWQQDWARAEEQLAQISKPELRRVGNVVWLQIHAARGEQSAVERDLAELAQGHPPALVIELTEELRLRFLEKKQGRHDDQWLRERTVDCLALAA
jgi:tetratricopeptide (TPR) repeat protein